jgi:hypothetical protein
VNVGFTTCWVEVKPQHVGFHNLTTCWVEVKPQPNIVNVGLS